MARRTSTHLMSMVVMAVAAAGLLLAGTVALAMIFGPPDLARPGILAGMVIAGMVLALGALWLLRDALDGHFRDIARLRGLAVALRAGDRVGENFPIAEDAEAGQLREALLSLADDSRNRASTPDNRLAAVLGALNEAVVVITANGQVSLVNGMARALLGAPRVEVGTSVFAALSRESVDAALAQARAAGGSVLVRIESVDSQFFDARVTLLSDDGGAVLAIACNDGYAAAEVAHDLSLHDLPPESPAPADDTGLAALPVTVLDVETTGLDPAIERIVAIGAVRMYGTSLFRAAAVDALVNPGVPIPRASTAVHGIADATVAHAPPFSAFAGDVRSLIGDSIVIGHNIGFDLAVLNAEAARAGVVWVAPVTIDTCQIAAALDPHEVALDLEDVAARHGVAVFGRHTALGDALVTAELWRRLIARLAERGITTLGGARAFAATATRVIARQRAAGW
jgi:DNA polymerase-3 subunit epsilon